MALYMWARDEIRESWMIQEISTEVLTNLSNSCTPTEFSPSVGLAAPVLNLVVRGHGAVLRGGIAIAIGEGRGARHGARGPRTTSLFGTKFRS